MKKALVTGGLGFIGSHLVEELNARGYEITIVDNLQSNVVDPSEKKKRYKVYVESIKDINLQNIPANIIFHLASPVGPVGVLKYPGKMAEMIINDTAKVRDVCMSKQIPFVFVSSSEIYGHSGKLDEEANKVFPSKYTMRLEYGAGKMLAEISLVNAAKAHPEFKYKIIRPFNVAGPRQLTVGGFVLPRFIQQCLSDEPVTVYGDGSQRRAFTDVRDVVDAISFVVETQEWNTIWNIGNPANEMSIKDLAWKVIEHTDSWSKIVYVDPKTIHGDWFEEVPDKIPYVEKLYSTGWRPKYTFEDTIDDAIKHMKEKKDGRGSQR